MKLATKVALIFVASAALLAASQEPVRVAVSDSVCCLLTALGLC
jgi:hypothetical protein